LNITKHILEIRGRAKREAAQRPLPDYGGIRSIYFPITVMWSAHVWSAL